MELRLKEIREARNMTQRQVAEGAGMSVSYYTEIENGKKQVNARRMTELAKFFDVMPQELIAGPGAVAFRPGSGREEKRRGAGKGEVANGDFQSLRLKAASDGALQLPAEVMAELGIEGGGTLFGRMENGKLTLVAPRVALRRVQAAVRPLRDRLRAEGRSIVGELISDRREEAEQGSDS